MNSTFADSNHYALPLPISPVYDPASAKLVRIDIVPTGNDNSIKPVTPYKIKPPSEYSSEYQRLRTDLKPLNVVQPEGASFKYRRLGETGEIIEWQKWFFRVGFNAREGLVLYDVRVSKHKLGYNPLLTSRHRSVTTVAPYSIVSPSQT